jgi:hypothetical protein
MADDAGLADVAGADAGPAAGVAGEKSVIFDAQNYELD